MEKDLPVILVGAGLAGSLLAIYLARKNYKVEIYERRPDMRKNEIGAGRSINLALSERGIHALNEVGLLPEIMKIALPMKGRMMHDVNGNLTFQPYGTKPHEVIYSVSRGILNMKLMDLAEQHEGVTIHFNSRCTGMNLETGDIQFIDELTGKQVYSKGQTVIGTDGSASALRMELQKSGRFNYSQTYLEHGYKELTIPPDANGNFQMDSEALHIWPRGTYMMIALPNPDKTFTCTLFFPYAGKFGFDSLNNTESLLELFSTSFKDSVPLLKNLTQEFFSNPTGSLITVKCGPWYYGDKLALLGDACHAVVPFFGQGMNCSFEDCSVLNQKISEFNGNWANVFANYFQSRKPNSDAIADMALENFIEMRDKVAQESFLFKKKVEHLLEEKFEGTFVSRYAMVSFTNLPYESALKKGVIQDEILEELCSGKSIVEEIDLTKAAELIKSKLNL